MDAQTLVDTRGDLWLALAPLWLEREPRETDYTRMIEEIERHGLSDSELEWVFRLELAPVLTRQQMSVAGEWREFDDYRLMKRLVAHNLRLTGWRRRTWALFSGLTTMMARHRFNELMERLMIARGRDVPS
ncbi:MULTISPECIES: DUF7079 family protein [Halomonas]|uniref:DUF7079 domain-containing protein n=1 Tax=Halomonas halophila TaxID=29573 RepID=A0ABQ0U339_9GAMM|nr:MULTISPECIES: hypothetical protein [Halomonas]MDR5888572.1 hypothetical protein [Halomonas salina]WJY07752.1 hypothetical protein QWG60_02335 [Halomonas halophila]GEK72959.1 hypothetical protein HHA04nite_15030 [Halomonas halophila]